jgi:CRP-like cAMP-binding protein
VKKLIEELKTIGQIRIFCQDEFLFHAGDRAEGFYYVQYGEVRIFRMDEHGREVEVVRLGPGDFFGEAIVFVAGEFPAYAQAVRKSQILYFSNKDVFCQIEKKPSTARSIITLLAQKCVVLNRRIETLELRSVRQRLAQFLLSFNPEDVAFEVELKMKKTELARFLGTIPETLSRNLRQLQEEKLIEVHGRRIAVLDRSLLKHLLFE